MNYGQFGRLAEEPGTFIGQTDPNNCICDKLEISKLPYFDDFSHIDLY